jgi:hypothetical protein
MSIPSSDGRAISLDEASRQLELAVHDAQVAYDCIALGNLDRAHTNAITARAAVDAAETVLRAALGGNAPGSDALDGGPHGGGDAPGGDAPGGDPLGGGALRGDPLRGDPIGGDPLRGDPMGGAGTFEARLPVSGPHDRYQLRFWPL